MPFSPDNLRVVLVGTRNPLNIGAAARAMSNFGFLRLRVVNPYHVAFREARSAMSAATVLTDAEEYKTVADAVADCTLVIGTTAIQHRELQHTLRPLDNGARLIRNSLLTGPVALLFGAEKTGLSNDDLTHCHWLMHIPTRKQHLSMNLGQAVAVCLYELASRAPASDRPAPDPAEQQPAPGPQDQPASSATIDLLANVIDQSMEAAAYSPPEMRQANQHDARLLLRRLALTERDARRTLGLFRRILWRLKR